MLAMVAFFLSGVAVVIHGRLLFGEMYVSGGLTLTAAISLIGLQLGVIGVLAAFNEALRGVSAGLLAPAALLALAAGRGGAANGELSVQMKVHVLTSMFAYGLLTVGAIVAIYALIQDRRLRSATLSPINSLFAPLVTTEKLLFAVTAAGFTVLLLSVFSGATFVEDLFAQHLVHKTTLSLVALAIFGILLLGRQFAGWRGGRAVSLYLSGFLVLVLAYFGSRFILENLLGRTWS